MNEILLHGATFVDLERDATKNLDANEMPENLTLTQIGTM
jgi:hypothetical protein